MDNISPVSEERTENKKARLLFVGGTLLTLYGATISKGKARPSASSLSHKLMIVGGAALILTNITLIILASLKVWNLKLPLIVCRSKSGGAHVFLFTKENIPASLMQSKLKQMSIILGYEGSEIFPKQTEILVDRGDTGNFLNLPYYNEMKGCLLYTSDAADE